MPKIKTNRAAAKRFKKTASGMLKGLPGIIRRDAKRYTITCLRWDGMLRLL